MQPTPDSPLRLPESRAAIRALQSARKREAVRRAKRAPFFAGKLDQVDLDRLDDPQMWAKIPIMDKDMLRSMSDAEFYRDCRLRTAIRLPSIGARAERRGGRCSIRAATATSWSRWKDLRGSSSVPAQYF